MDLDFDFDYCKRLDNLVAAEAAVASAELQSLVVGCFGIDYFDSDFDWLLDGS